MISSSTWVSGMIFIKYVAGQKIGILQNVSGASKPKGINRVAKIG